MKTLITRICFEKKESIEEKTDFFVMFFWLFISSIFPGIIIWLLIGYDFNLIHLNNLNTSRALITISYILWVYLSCAFFYYFAFVRSEMFMFNTSFWIIIVIVIYSQPIIENIFSGIKSHQQTIELITRFVVALFFGLFGIMIGAFFHWLLLNNEFRIKEQYELKNELLKSNSKQLTEKDKKWIESINNKIYKINEKINIKKNENDLKLKKINEKLNMHMSKVELINQKLDAKEKKEKEKEI